MNWSIIRDWGLVVMGLGFLFYAAWSIKTEQNAYIQHAIQYRLNNFCFLVPHWWTSIDAPEQTLVFRRTDTYYDWQASVQVRPDRSELKLEELLAQELSQREILFDQDCEISQTASLFLRGPEFIKHVQAFLRIEGTATGQETDRLYLDIVFIRFKQTSELLYLESKSSVLNGSVEGPYFEEVLKRLQFV